MTDTTRVAVVTHYYPTSADPAAGQSAYQTLRILAQRCQVHVFVPEMTYPPMLTPPGGRAQPLDRDWRMPGVDVSYIPYPIFPVVSRPLNGAVIARRLLPAVKAFQPDIILSYVVYSNGYAAVSIARHLGVPVVLTAIGSDLNRIPDLLCRRLTVSALRRANAVITVSRDLRRTAIALGANPAHTHAELNGCDTAVFHPADRVEARRALNLDPAAQIILYVGRLDLRKGLIELVDAFATLAPSQPTLRLVLVGDGPDRAPILQAIERHHLQTSVTIAPPCPTEAVARWMAAADLVTLPSYNEGCPNVVVEALSAGRPVVATNVGGIPELVDSSVGILVPPRDVPPLATALAHTLASSWDAAKISSTHRKSWQDVADGVFNILETTLNESRKAV